MFLPNYFALACTVALIPPSSAICERFFALLVISFVGDLGITLGDYEAASTVLRFDRS